MNSRCRTILLFLLVTVMVMRCAPPKRVTGFESQSQSSKTEPKESLDWEDYAKRYPGQEAVVLQSHASAEHHFKMNFLTSQPTWNYYENRRRRYLVLDPDSEVFGQFEERVHSGRQLTNLSLRVTRPDGSTRSYTRSDVKTTRDEYGRLTFRFVYPELERGTVIDEQFEVVQEDVVDNPVLTTELPIQFRVPCEHVTARFAYPQSWRHALKHTGEGRLPQLNRGRSEDGKTRYLDYDARNVPAIPDEPFSPPFKKLANYLEFTFEKVAGYVLYPSWESIGLSLANRFVDNDSHFSGRLSKTANRVAGEGTVEERTRVLVGWIRENIELSDEPTPGNFAKILKQGKADPITMTGLTVKMLTAIRVPSRMALIHSADDGYFDEEFISPNQFYIPCALTTSYGEISMVLFPYFDYLPIGFVPEEFRGEKALSFTEQGTSEFVTIPEVEEDSGLVEESYRVEIGSNGILTVRDTKRVFGANAYLLRNLLAEMEESDIDELIEEFISYEDGEVDLTGKHIRGRESTDAPLEFELEYTIDNLVTLTPDEVLFSTAGLFSPLSKTKVKVVSEERANPIQINGSQKYSKRVRIAYPSEWNLESAFEDVSMENRFGSLNSVYTEEDGVLEVELTLNLKPIQAGKDAFPELIELISTKNLDTMTHLVFGRQGG